MSLFSLKSPNLLRRKSSRNLETESLLSLANESFNVATKLTKEAEELLTNAQFSRDSLSCRLELWRETKKPFQEAEQVWRSVIMVLDEEKQTAPECFTAEREEMANKVRLQIEIVTIHLAWINVYEAETIAAIYFEKSQQQLFTTPRTSTFNNQVSSSPSVPRQPELSEEGLKSLVLAQQSWKSLLLTLPYPFQMNIWNEYFKIRLNYPDLFDFWSYGWKNALKCRYDTIIALNKTNNVAQLAAGSSTKTVSSLSSSSDHDLTKALSSLSVSSVVLDTLTEYKRTEETIWDELIQACQIIRSKFQYNSIYNDYWKLIILEIEFQKSYTLIEKYIISIQSLKNEIEDIAISYPFIKYDIEKVEKKREKSGIHGNKTFIDQYEVIQLLGADVGKIKHLCYLWKELKEELKLEEEYCYNTVSLFEALCENDQILNQKLQRTKRKEDEELLLQKSNSYFYSSSKWKLYKIEELIHHGKTILDSVAATSASSSAATSDSTSSTTIDEDHSSFFSFSSTDFVNELEEAKELFLKAKGLSLQITEKYRKIEFSMWKPPKWKETTLCHYEQTLNSGFYDYHIIRYQVPLIKIFLEKITQYREMLPFKQDLEEFILGVPDYVRKEWDILFQKQKSLQDNIEEYLRNIDQLIGNDKKIVN
jgi:hypothetical protein